MIASMRLAVIALLLLVACESAPSPPDASPMDPRIEELGDLICDYSERCDTERTWPECMSVAIHCDVPWPIEVVNACSDLGCADQTECLLGFDCPI